MSIPARFLEEIRNRLTLSEVIGRRIKLVRAGREFKACCPFHHEKSPSFYVNDDKQFYHCFGCGAHGDVLGFVMRHDHLSFPEAVESLAAQAGLRVPEQSPADIARARTEKSLYDLLECAAQYFIAQIQTASGRESLSYLRERGLRPETLSAWRVGYAPADYQALRTHLRDKGYTDSQMIESGLLRISSKGGQPYCLFRDRIMFPVGDSRGRVVGFGGRIVPDSFPSPYAAASPPPKYINSPDTPLFHKGTLLYGDSHARHAAGEGHSLVVVEGYLDVIACAQAGFRGAIAPLGTALTEDQILRIWKMIPESRPSDDPDRIAPMVPVLCFDGDNAGRRAAQRACVRILPLLSGGRSVRIAFLPEGEDPDSILRRQGKATFESVLRAALPLVEFLWQSHTAGRRFDTPESRAGLEAALSQDILAIADRQVQHYYRQTIRQKIRDAFSDFQPRKIQSSKSRIGKGGGSMPALPLMLQNTYKISARVLLATLINHPDIFEGVEDSFVRLEISEPDLDQLRQDILGWFASHADAQKSLDRQALHAHLCRAGHGEVLARILSEPVYVHAGFARPQAEYDQARSGWLDIWRRIEKQGVWQDIKDAGASLALDFTEENEHKVFALQRMGHAD